MHFAFEAFPDVNQSKIAYFNQNKLRFKVNEPCLDSDFANTNWLTKVGDSTTQTKVKYSILEEPQIYLFNYQDHYLNILFARDNTRCGTTLYQHNWKSLKPPKNITVFHEYEDED